MVNNEKEEGSTNRSIKLSRLKLVEYCIQLTIAKNEFFSIEPFWSMVVCLLTSHLQP